MIAAGILALVALAGCTSHTATTPSRSATTQPTRPSVAEQTTPASSATSQAPPAPRTASVLGSGDVLVHPQLWQQAHADARAEGRTGYDFAPMYASVAPDTRAADLATCELESPLAPPQGPFTGWPTFNAPPQVLTALKGVGYDTCTTASNHSLDAGYAGVKRTLDELDAAGLRHTGSARTAQEALTPLIVTLPNGVRIGQLAYAFGFNGIPLPADKPWLANLIDVPRILAAAKLMKRAGADIVVLSMHWGTEYDHLATAEQRSQARALLSSPDIDLILGDHDYQAPDATVRLILNGVTITSTSSAAIAATEIGELTVILADGSTNTLTDTSSYAEDADVNAALFSAGDLTITGTGALTVHGKGNDAIASKDGLVVDSGTITVDAVDDGVRGKDYVVVNDGTLTITSGGDGMKADNDADADAGFISIAGGTVAVESGGDGIDAYTDLVMTGGTVTVASGGGHTTQPADTVSTKGLKSGITTVLEGGTAKVDSSDDAVHSDGTVHLVSTALTAASGDDAVHAEQTLQVDGGTVDVTASVEGLEAKDIVINAGSVQVVSSDDGVNASPPSDSDTADGGGGGGPGGGEPVADVSVTVTGGTWSSTPGRRPRLQRQRVHHGRHGRGQRPRAERQRRPRRQRHVRDQRRRPARGGKLGHGGHPGHRLEAGMAVGHAGLGAAGRHDRADRRRGRQGGGLLRDLEAGAEHRLLLVRDHHGRRIPGLHRRNGLRGQRRRAGRVGIARLRRGGGDGDRW